VSALTPTDVTHFAAENDFRRWLDRYHADRDVLWVGYFRKGTGRPSVTWEETVDVALCFGWIDGIRKRIDEESYTIRFTPRRSGSVWSNRNLERYAAMLAEGKVAPAGAAAYARRKEAKTGVYSFEQAEPLVLAPEFEDRLKADPTAWADWETRPPGYRRQATHWVMSAKREDTRERRFAQLLEECAAGEKVKPLRRNGD
jgi:uncharacterized protein YdeI (YjbR/CyaY-like superfamily)